MMENEKNISLILKQPEESSNEVVISFATILKKVKKFGFTWIMIAVIMGMFVISGIILFGKQTTETDSVTALVSYSYSGIESGLAPDGSRLDVNKIKSPSVIEASLTNLDMSLSYVENVRSNISIKGIIPDDALDKISLYQSVYANGGNSALSAVESLLEIGYYPSYYVINFDYQKTPFDIETGKKVIDEVLNSYQEYFFQTYSFNESLGNAITVVDYEDYDYPQSVDVFNSTLDSLSEYVQKLDISDETNFRSNVTGYTFGDIYTAINTIKSSDLDSLSSYITINDVTNDKQQLLTYYEYKIDELNRELKVYQSKLDSISKSIDEYEKDTLLVFGENNSTNDEAYTQTSKKYDELIMQKIDAQDDVSKCKQNISYYNDRLDALNNNKVSKNIDIEYVEEQIDMVYEKIMNLIEITNDTSDEYYENVVFADAYNILVPATGEEPNIHMSSFGMPLIIVEGIIFVVFIAIVFITSIVEDYYKKKSSNTENE